MSVLFCPHARRRFSWHISSGTRPLISVWQYITHLCLPPRLLLGEEVLLPQEGFSRERDSALVLVTVGFGLEKVSLDPKSLGVWAFQVEGTDVPCLCTPNSGGEWEDPSDTASEHPDRK